VKPRLTAKVLDGLSSMASQIEAGDYTGDGGELEDSADAVLAACRWVRAMQRWKAGGREEGT
jgi:hypothetical protein